MKYLDFQKTFASHPLIDTREVKNIFPEYTPRRFYEWQKKGYLKKIINSFYIFTDQKLNENELCFIANKLVEPSYLSLEYALSYYNLIPETVYLITNITTRKTKIIETSVGNFQYRSLKKSLFFAYKIIGLNGISFKIAEPEKALLDFLYLRSDLKNVNDLEELRINSDVFKEIINPKKIEQYLAIFNSASLTSKVKKLNKILC